MYAGIPLAVVICAFISSTIVTSWCINKEKMQVHKKEETAEPTYELLKNKAIIMCVII